MIAQASPIDAMPSYCGMASPLVIKALRSIAVKCPSLAKQAVRASQAKKGLYQTRIARNTILEALGTAEFTDDQRQILLEAEEELRANAGTFMLRVVITEPQRHELASEALKMGLNLSELVRLKLFGNPDPE